ncbi:DNA helicase, partial [Roseomonas sp. GC11]|uniref:helicase-related protein n=1 Tax=Roseomonas sp. GC11 TaxID=2950546 RepID=UPI00210A8DCE
MPDRAPTSAAASMFPARVKAVLGPTNTGKTHLAITRMLAHASGIIGFPLRLLARENYDRMVAVKGEQQVALITGEEKIIPPGAKWFACTVEAMPLDRRVEFVAVDEIQLCADPDRGHVFTDRLLRARGMVETMFLGAETIRPLLQRLVPQAEIETRPRLSELRHAGPAKLTRLPPRSAVVAFSAGEVYAIAEAIRRRRGGCAVVMGRLSPRTRNAQVALYQNREVDFLVATDAIGMGLNMDVDHVAFASLQKFDGHRPRPLSAQEAAQIAGRAGRGMRDGSFGVTADCPPLPEEMVAKIEGHQFESLQTLAWRNAALDFSGVDALLDSLAAPPPVPGLSKGHDATDHITLEALSRDAEIRQMARGTARVRLLWEACQIPDFRKLADDSHTRLCARIFGHLVKERGLPAEWVAAQIAQCASTEGDLDTLMARLSAIRVWTYIAARADWMRDAARFQDAARAAEDAVSDALHERLTARFVDRRAAHLIRRLDESADELLSAVTRQGEVVVEGHPVGQVKGFVFEPDAAAGNGEERKLVLRAARRALQSEMPKRVTEIETASDDAFALTPSHRITWNGDEVARLRPGPTPDKPLVEPLPSDLLDGAQRERIRARLATWLEALLKREFAPLDTVETKAAEDGALRGPAFRLREYLGLVPGGTEAEVNPELRQKLKGIGIRAGRFALYLPEMLKPRPMALRAQLWALKADCDVPAVPGGGLVSVPPPEGWPEGFAETMGWVKAGPVLLRLDVAERVAGELGHLTRRAPAMLPPDVASRLGVKADILPAVLQTLGFRLITAEPLAEDAFGPPSPAMVSARREEHRHGPRRHGPGQGQRREGERGGPRGERREGERGPR